MSGTSAFSARMEKGPDFDAVVLAYDGTAAGRARMEARVVPAYGSNLCQFSVAGWKIIDFSLPLLLGHDYTGTPVLYPTPNRVRNGIFTWRGREYRQVKAGTLVVEHGLVHGEPWAHGEPRAEAESARVETWIDFRPGDAIFDAFPFPHRLTLGFALTAHGLSVRYSIRNDGDQEIPFGFGLHPYFMKLSGDAETFLSVQAGAVMEATPDLLPTGGLFDVQGTPFDLRSPRALGSLDLDQVFTRLASGGGARIEYRSIGMSVDLEATTDFTHAVVYSPKGEGFFCLENQTCSKDAHNLFDRGFALESGLKTVPPRGLREGTVTYAVMLRGKGARA
jgi:aldose 1-epimerase